MVVSNLGAHSFGLTWACDAAEAVERFSEHGFSCFELLASVPHLDPFQPRSDVVKRARAAGGEIIGIDLASSDVNLASPSRDVRDFGYQAYERAIETAENLGATWVGLVGGRRHAILPPPDDRLVDAFREVFERILRAAEKRGVRVMLENHPQSLLADAGTIDVFLEEGGYGTADVLYDVANANAIGENAVDGLNCLLPRVAVVHLSDSPVNVWRHDPIGTGDIDFAAVGSFLDSRDYKGRILLEIISSDSLKDMIDGRSRLKALGLTCAQGA